MKKKVLYGVFMALFAVVTMGTLQSCTDDLSDFEHQYVYDQYNLGQDIANLQQQINDNKAQCESEIARLEQKILANTGDIEQLKKDLEDLNGMVEKMYTNEQVDSLLQELEKNLQEDITEKVEANLAAMKELLQGYVTTENFNKALDEVNEKLTKDEANIADLLTRMTTTEGAIDAINTELENLMNQVASQGVDIATIKEEISKMKSDIQTLKNQYKTLDDSLNELWGSIYGEGGLTTQISQMWNALNEDLQETKAELLNEIDYINTQLSGIRSQLNNLISRVDDLITSIMVQATDSPVFGNFSLPLGIQSNMLFNWYFKSLVGESYIFPSADATYAYNSAEVLDDTKNGRFDVTAEDVATAIGSKGDAFEVPEGYADVNLGKIYMTINPVGHNVINGKDFYLETSKGAEGRLHYTINVKESNDELMFGYQRSAENGFYEAEVIVPGSEEMINESKVDITSGLKSDVKDLLDNPSKRGALNLLQAVYDQLNSSFPQYAVRAEWKNSDPTSRSYYSVLSKYDLGVATAQPLSFQFLDGKGTDRRLRTFGHFDNIFYYVKDNDKLQFTFDGIIDLEGVKMEVTPLTKDDVNQIQIQVIVPTSVIYNPNTGNYEVNYYYTGTAVAESTDQIRQAIADAVNSAMTQAGVDVEAYMQKVVDAAESQLEDYVNGKIDSALAQLGDKSEPWFQRLNRLVDIYNRVANKINTFLKEPNEYLQPAMFYKTTNGIGIVSQAKNDPTVFEYAGGDSFVVYPTSYTAEIVAPAYKKMVACVNVIDNATGNYASNGRQLAKNFNATSNNLAKVLDGSIYGILIPGSALQAGKTYEIMYQALDYSGYTSTRKFYIKVK